MYLGTDQLGIVDTQGQRVTREAVVKGVTTLDKASSQQQQALETNLVELTPEEKKMTDRKRFVSKILTSVSNFSVQYNFQAIAISLLVMSETVCTATDDSCKAGNQDEWVGSTASATIFIGAIFGQLTMGYLGDYLGRNKALFFTLCLASFGALGKKENRGKNRKFHTWKMPFLSSFS